MVTVPVIDLLFQELTFLSGKNYESFETSVSQNEFYCAERRALEDLKRNITLGADRFFIIGGKLTWYAEMKMELISTLEVVHAEEWIMKIYNKGNLVRD